MKLKSVTLENFKCFEKLTVDLHPRLTVLVGTNGAGKTAILDGIATGLTPILTHLSSANQRLAGRRILDTDFRVESWKGRGGKEKWGAADFTRVEVETTDGLKWDHWKSSVKDGQPKHKIGQSDLSERLARIQGSYKNPLPELTPVVAYYGAQRGYIKIPDRLRGSEHNYGYPTAGLIGALDATSDFKELLKWFDQAEATELRLNKGRVDEEFAPTTELSAVREAVIQLLGGKFENPHFNADHRFVLKPVGSPYLLQVSQLSQGYQSMLAMGMDFARRLALANEQLNYPEGGNQVPFEDLLPGFQLAGDVQLPESPSLKGPAVMLVDEIDLHLHPAWQQRVLHDLMRTFPNTQFIVTTHSPQVLTTVNAECIRLLVQNNDEQTGLQRTTIEPATFQTKGVASTDALLEIMHTNPTPDEPEAGWLEDYQALIQQDLAQSDEALALHTKLVAHFGADHPAMQNCERLIRLQGYKRRSGADASKPSIKD
jgi:predicted ATP-binding protein involved in virulence